MRFRIKKLRKDRKIKKRAEKIIEELFNFGFNFKNENSDKIYREVGKLIWKIKLSYKISLPLEIKRFICRKCNTILIPGKTLRVRNYAHNMEYKCLNCGYVRRYKLK